MIFSADYLASRLKQHLDKHLLVAFSGGLDSHVLLHALAQLPNLQLSALHINHGLNPDAVDWSLHCQRICDDLGVSLNIMVVNATPQRGESPEAAAREARYKALSACLNDAAVLLTAQHQDDQLETVLLQLMRGAGPKGLSGMPVLKPLGQGLQLRPLLEVTREELAAYAQKHTLQWCEDPSNADRQFDRNFLRHEIIPLLAQRWPSLSSTVSRSARLCAKSAQWVHRQASEDLDLVRTHTGAALSVSAILGLPSDRSMELLRLWFREQGTQLPSESLLIRIINEVLMAREDAQPLVSWDKHSVRRYRNKLYLVFATPSIDLPWQQDWKTGNELHLPKPLGTLVWQGDSKPQMVLQVKPRIGGERFTQKGRKHSHSLKKILQDAGVPPWIRNGMPLIYKGEELIALPYIGISEALNSSDDDIHWLQNSGLPWWI